VATLVLYFTGIPFGEALGGGGKGVPHMVLIEVVYFLLPSLDKNIACRNNPLKAHEVKSINLNTGEKW